jgi:hypothetical protein
MRVAGRFQFSLRHLLIGVTLFCVAAWLTSQALHEDLHDLSAWLPIFGFVIFMAAIAGASAGSTLGKSLQCAVVFATVIAILLIIFFITSGPARVIPDVGAPG